MVPRVALIRTDVSEQLSATQPNIPEDGILHQILDKSHNVVI
jgi:hypothetical protein